MLSEVHDTDVITLWLKKWLRLGVVSPHEIVCDGALALLNAVSLTFNNRSLSDYIELCFNNIKNINTTKPNQETR